MSSSLRHDKGQARRTRHRHRQEWHDLDTTLLGSHFAGPVAGRLIWNEDPGSDRRFDPTPGKPLPGADGETQPRAGWVLIS